MGGSQDAGANADLRIINQPGLRPPLTNRRDDMTSIINAATFTASAEQPDEGYSWIEGTVEVTLRNETRTVSAEKCNRYGRITAYGMTGRYQTGTKAWPATVMQMVDPRTGKLWDFVSFGRDDRASKFQKLNGLHFA